MAKEKKQRADKYEEKVSFDGTFEDMVKMSFSDNNPKHYNVHFIIKYPSLFTQKHIVRAILKNKEDRDGAINAIKEWLHDNKPNDNFDTYEITDIEAAK